MFFKQFKILRRFREGLKCEIICVMGSSCIKEVSKVSRSESSFGQVERTIKGYYKDQLGGLSKH